MGGHKKRRGIKGHKGSDTTPGWTKKDKMNIISFA
jgi:hypothetical protein